MAEQLNKETPMVTLRMPLSNWRGIVDGIESWVRR